MKQHFLSTAFILFFIGALHAQYSLEVTVMNINEVTGSIRVGLFDSNEENFLKTPLKGQIVKTSGKMVKVIFENIPKGIYAVSVIHDVNENNELDKNFIGIPKEGFGFSNNAMGSFGPPKFKEASFTIPETKTITVNLKYM
jgi:uncharacterized protein (DUF2141 family)